MSRKAKLSLGILARTGALVLALGLAACGDDEGAVGPKPAADAASGTDVQQPGLDTVDAGPETEVTPGTDAAIDQAGDVAAACPGSAGCACADDKACGTGGKCLATASGKTCAKTCTSTCDAGFVCKKVEAADTATFCVPSLLTVCAPCSAHKDCQVAGQTDALCLSYGDAGKFCGGACTDDASCGSEYACVEVTDEGKTSKQCKLKAAQAVCSCSAWAKSAGTQTECKSSNAEGSCGATRKCAADGLEVCKAATPVAETCNGQDDNCDGKTDVLAATATCSVEAFKDGGSGKACTKDADCTDAGEACDEAAAKCKTLLGKCTGSKPTCGADGKLVCDAAPPAGETCNGKDDDCNGATDEGLCDDSNACTDNVCDGKACSNPANSAPCDDKNACTSGDACDKGNCTGKAKDCDDKDACTADSCDTNSGSCATKNYEGSCSDSNACTGGDVCGLATGGAWTCLPGANAVKCDDNNVCTDDSCDGQKGCQNKPNAGTAPCYGGPGGTQDIGLCKAGSKQCKDGALGSTCVGEVLPTATEACNGVDDSCNGQVDEGCKPTSISLSFSNAYLAGQSGKLSLQLVLGPSGPAGKAEGSGKLAIDFGFFAWLKAATGLK